MKSGNLKKAEEYYQKSLSLDASNQNAKDMLKKIQKSRQVRTLGLSIWPQKKSNGK